MSSASPTRCWAARTSWAPKPNPATTPRGVADINYTLTLRDAEPTDDDLLPEPVLTEALAAAILNAPHFVVATPDSPCEDTITVQTGAASVTSWSSESAATAPAPTRSSPPRRSTRCLPARTVRVRHEPPTGRADTAFTLL
ncbi:hypothetical protein [Streptomyces sp. NPDC058240]|uniref:hypothetical protein n=1 Tax=Streptomyces sp. NPDC058240 TaxID=3346396 RepID=UPI0036F01177